MKHQRKAKMVARAVRVALARAAKLSNEKDITTGQRMFLKRIKESLIQADLRCEAIEAEFAVSHDPIIHLGN